VAEKRDAVVSEKQQPWLADLMESRRLLHLVWNHMHGQNIDGTTPPGSLK
jgi:hypothetical protein